MSNKKQLKITRLFKKAAVSRLPEVEDYEDIQNEISQLEDQLRQKHDELFQLQRISCRRKLVPPKKITETFVRPEKIVLSNSIDTLKKELELMSMLSGVEVESYVLEDHCCITYMMPHYSQYEIKHGLRIELQGGAKVLSKASLPLGFNLDAVMEDYDNIMMPECLGAIRRALVAYYDRLEQHEELKKMLNMEAQLFRMLDGSHMQITFVVNSEVDQEMEPFDLVLQLDYRVYDIRPKKITFNDDDLPEGAADLLRDQCMVFKRKTLKKAFKEAFINNFGPFKFVEQVGVREVAQRRPRNNNRTNQYYNNDDTYLPDCSEHSDEVDT